jgi:hypothetical protein
VNAGAGRHGSTRYLWTKERVRAAVHYTLYEQGVIVGPTMTVPQETYDPYDSPYACPARLHEAGIRFCIRSAGTTNTRNLPYEAAMAVSYGLPLEEGLKAVTLYPAQILGVAEQLGTIEAGKRANLVLADGDILQASTQALAPRRFSRSSCPTATSKITGDAFTTQSETTADLLLEFFEVYREQLDLGPRGRFKKVSIR